MGNREKLVDGALTCLLTKGFARTTARDVAAAAGVSLAAIGYHFGTTEALLSVALVRAMEQWGEELEHALASEEDQALSPQDRFTAIWRRVINSVGTNRPLWATQFEVLTQLERSPELREKFLGNAPEGAGGNAQEQAQFGLAALFDGIDPAAEPELARQVGAFYQVLLTGVVAQHLVDPEHAISGEDLLIAIRAVASRR
ncbi:TetR family transcriptional regulator [Dactylosporangium cerinum]|uniref:TetR family transcriptional regulator n=1 Tax=Dactylosporangium cerinum TaxID=1434730 RepID=A0ABV9WB62_9ACTN